jgi:hypothetical protein
MLIAKLGETGLVKQLMNAEADIEAKCKKG